nr:2-phosphosulfolactate phosphatase [Sunxiuqinia sp.]
MDIKIFQLLDGAKQAEGLTVIIDVFRAFSVACYAFDGGVSRIYPVGQIDLAYQIKLQNPEYL